MAAFYSVRATKRQLTGSLRVNDVPILGWREPKETTAVEAINLWIPGRNNRVAVDFEWPDHAAALAPHLELVVQSTTGDQGPTEAITVARFQWPAATDLLARPATVEFRFSVEEPPPSRLWPALQPLQLDDPTRAAALALLGVLNTALTAHDLQRTTALLEFKADDIGLAMHFAAGEARTSQREFLEFFFDQPGFAMEPLDPARVKFELVADRRLVMASRPDGSPVLRSAPGSVASLSLPVFLAPVRGEWTIVR